LVLGLKRGDEEARDLVAGALIRTVGSNQVYLRDVRNVRYVVPLPGHAPGGTNSGMIKVLADRLAAAFPWLRVAAGIERTRPVQKSSLAAPGKRESVQSHFESFGWVGDPIEANESVLLLDDVITLGHTSAAARKLIMASTSCRSVLGLFVARTM